MAGPNDDILRWPSWRGPEASGSTSGGPYAHRFSATEKLLWRVELPGVGCSTPIVWDERIFVTAPEAGSNALLAYTWSGKLAWRKLLGKERAGKHRNGSGSNASPVTDGERVFAYFKSGDLAALAVSGEILWQTNLLERFGEEKLYWDAGTSPVLTEERVVMTMMHGGDSYLVAFDKKSGDTSWKVARNYDCPPEGDHSYATPTLIRHRGDEAILVWGAEHLTAHDVADGSLLWFAGGFNPDRTKNWVAVASAVVADGVAVVPYGRGTHLVGVKLDGEGDVTASHRAWLRTGVGSFVPTAAAQDGKVYVLGDRGEVTCIEPTTGATVWSDRLPEHRGKYYASPLVADGKLYAAREDGVVFVARVTGGFKVLAENDMGERMIASPVPAGGRLLLRGERHLFCVGAP